MSDSPVVVAAAGPVRFLAPQSDTLSIFFRHSREGDAVGRIGGEELLLVLPGAATLMDVELVAERLRLAVEQHNWSGLQPELRVTASIGLAIGQVGEAAEHVLNRADQGLYQAK